MRSPGRRMPTGTSKRAGTNWLPATARRVALAHVDRHAHAQRVDGRAVRLVIAAEAARDARDEGVVQLSPHALRAAAFRRSTGTVRVSKRTLSERSRMIGLSGVVAGRQQPSDGCGGVDEPGRRAHGIADHAAERARERAGHAARAAERAPPLVAERVDDTLRLRQHASGRQRAAAGPASAPARERARPARRSSAPARRRRRASGGASAPARRGRRRGPRRRRAPTAAARGRIPAWRSARRSRARRAAPPPAGARSQRTWNLRSKCGSTSQRGGAIEYGFETTRWRRRGIVPRGALDLVLQPIAVGRAHRATRRR